MTAAWIADHSMLCRYPSRIFRLLAVGMAVWLVHCAGGGEQQEDRNDSVRAALEAFLPRLSEAYASGDVGSLRELAGPGEVAAVEERIRDLADRGMVLDVALRDVTVERTVRVSPSTIAVTTVESWDVRSREAGSHRLLAEERGKHSRVKYQLRREGSGWVVLSRMVPE